MAAPTRLLILLRSSLLCRWYVEEGTCLAQAQRAIACSNKEMKFYSAYTPPASGFRQERTIECCAHRLQLFAMKPASEIHVQDHFVCSHYSTPVNL